MALIPEAYDLARLTTNAFAEIVAEGRPVVVMLPVGSVEPHGPHLPFETDTVISEVACVRAAEMLHSDGFVPLIAPAVPYGVTECAKAFPGAVSVSVDALTAYLKSVTEGFLANGVAHVCLVNNHLEPEHDAAVRASIDGFTTGTVSVACPLTRRWARTLSDEFKSGACHAGKYETSIVLAANDDLVDDEARKALPEVPISLSEKLKAGVNDFAAMGLSQAYAGAPAEADASHGREMIERLAEMIATEIREALNATRDNDL